MAVTHGDALSVRGSANRRLVLSGLLLDRIARYAFKYRNGGWQSRLRRIFGRTLGPTLDGRAGQKAA